MRAHPTHFIARCLAAAVLMHGANTAWAQAADASGQQRFEACGSLRNHYGPYDYRRDLSEVRLVNQHHFPQQVELLVRGVSGTIGAELDYLLMAIPNHHRAMVAMIRWGERLKSDKPPGATHTIECYLDRAIRFAKDDPIPRMLYARYLHTLKRTAESAAQLDQVVYLAGDNALTHYNAGLVFAEIGMHDRALVQAHKAFEMGYTRTDLKEILEKAGKWKDAPK